MAAVVSGGECDDNGVITREELIMATTDYKKLYDEAAGDKEKYMAAALQLPTGKKNALMFWLQFERQKEEFRTDVLFIEGAGVSTITLPEFSQVAIMAHMEITKEELDKAIAERNEGLFTDENATDITIQHSINQTVVTVFNGQGEAYFYIGPNSKWLG